MAGHGHSAALKGPDRLTGLEPLIEQAIAFAEHWDEMFRPKIFALAIEVLMPGTSFVRTGSSLPESAHKRTDSGSLALPDGAASAGAAMSRLARSLDCEPSALERIVQIDTNGTVDIIARLEGKTRHDTQTRYSLAYCYVKEIGFGERSVDIAQLRFLCSEHGCYDAPNFTANFRSDAKLGLIREIGQKGARSRRYIATKRGLDEAATILRRALQE